MKKILMGILMVIAISSCNTRVPNQPQIKIQANIINRINKDNNFKNLLGAFYSIQINIINNTDQTFRFWSKSCSWQENWISNNDSLHLFNWGCDSNYPKILEIKSKQKLTYNGIIQVFDTTILIKHKGVRLGFINVKENEVRNPIYFDEVLFKKLNNRVDIIWSNPIYFPPLPHESFRVAV